MSLSKNLALALPLLLSISFTSGGQVCRNTFPYAEGVVYDNNGHDLKAFILSNKSDLLSKGARINEYSNGGWGYIQISNAKVPSLDNDGNMNFSQFINATLVLYKTKDGAEATWWARQCNTEKGPLVNTKVDAGDLGMPLVRYEMVTDELEQKPFTIVDCFSDTYNEYDFDELVKSYLIVKNGTVKNFDDYKTIIPFYNNFLKRFAYVEDPLLYGKSFITLFTVNGTKYVGWFNTANSKLAGHLETVHIDYEKDKSILLNNLFSKLTGSIVYIYGDDLWGMDKALKEYRLAHPDKKIVVRRTNTTKVFNEKW